MNKGVLHKVNEFERLPHKMPWGEIIVDLLPSEGEKKNGVAYWGAPYHLKIWFLITDENAECFVSIERIRVYEKGSKKLVLDDTNLASAFDKRFGGKRMAAFQFPRLYLNYTSHFIKMDYGFSGDCNMGGIDKFEANVFTNYREEVVTFWDILMGV